MTVSLLITELLLGVTFRELPGEIPLASGHEPILLQLFAKLIRQDNRVFMRVIGFALSLKRGLLLNWTDTELSQHPAAVGWQPNMTIIGSSSRQEWYGTPASNKPMKENNKHGKARLVMPLR